MYVCIHACICVTRKQDPHLGDGVTLNKNPIKIRKQER